MMYLHKTTTPKILISILITFLFLCASTSSYAQTTYHVNASSGNDTNDGLSWTSAFLTLQKAIDEAVVNDEIWVAEGTYLPTQEADGTINSERHYTFYLTKDLKIYGGFPNTGTPTIGDRDWENNVTKLSGDFNGDDVPISDKEDTDFPSGNNGENAYTVVRTSNLSSTSLMDGFFVEGGNANLGSGIGPTPNRSGGGMYNRGSNPTLTNCSFSYNSANNDGGGMFNYLFCNPTLTNCSFSNNSAGRGGGMINDRGDPTLTNCSFSNNSTDKIGGGMYNFRGDPTLINCSFSNNSADSNGGGIYDLGGDPTLINCSFSYNSAGSGGGMYNEDSNPTLTNCILWGNGSEIFNIGSSPKVTYSIVEDGYTGTGNLDQDPQFINPADKDLTLADTSPAIDAGNNLADLDGSGSGTQTIADVLFDLVGNARIIDFDKNGMATVDMGAFEAGEAPTVPTLSEWGLLNLALLLMICGTLVLLEWDDRLEPKTIPV